MVSTNHELEMQLIAAKLALVEKENVFDDEEMKIIRRSAFLSCVEVNEICLSAAAVARLSHHSATTIRKWCWNAKIKCYKDYRGKDVSVRWPWYEIPLREVVNLKRTNWVVDEFINLDIKKVDF